MEPGVSHRTFADDTKLFADVSVPGNRDALQRTLANIETWANRWKLMISTPKSAVLHVLHDTPSHYALFGDIVPERVGVKDLGVLISSKLDPDAHITDVLMRSGRVANFIHRAFVSRLPRTYIRAYKALVLPILLYGSPAWRPWLMKHIRAIENFQKLFLRRTAYKCGIDVNCLVLPSISTLLDEADRSLCLSIIKNPDFSNFFDSAQTITRAQRKFKVPLARKNVVHHSFRWRVSRRSDVKEILPA
ncbi:uncharacterized protein LOC108864341 [Galendromus occidentalis]|uniref:Uncharacterized protein LOC108864341 n=1 Tax=Galendromus occidentalis TaxID=34638 RepID=A0AAJ7L472_9ACAR|nr:uncharacterized protein LOC108864341 [Galendromus occidentalis]